MRLPWEPEPPEQGDIVWFRDWGTETERPGRVIEVRPGSLRFFANSEEGLGLRIDHLAVSVETANEIIDDIAIYDVTAVQKLGGRWLS